MTDGIYVVIGKKHSELWAVRWRPTVDEAELLCAALRKQAEEFASWKLRMQLNNAPEHYQDLIDEYIEKMMLDPHFEEGVEYDMLHVAD